MHRNGCGTPVRNPGAEPIELEGVVRDAHIDGRLGHRERRVVRECAFDDECAFDHIPAIAIGLA